MQIATLVREIERLRSLVPALSAEDFTLRMAPLMAEIKLRWSYMHDARFIEIIGLVLNEVTRIPTWADLRDVDKRLSREWHERERERIEAARFEVPPRIKREREILEGARIGVAELTPAELDAMKSTAESELRALCGSASDRYIDHMLKTQLDNQIESVYAHERMGKDLLAVVLDGIPSRSCDCHDCRRRFAGVIPFAPLSDRQRGALAAAGIDMTSANTPPPGTLPTSTKHATAFGCAMEEPPPPLADWRAAVEADDGDVGF